MLSLQLRISTLTVTITSHVGGTSTHSFVHTFSSYPSIQRVYSGPAPTQPAMPPSRMRLFKLESPLLLM